MRSTRLNRVRLAVERARFALEDDSPKAPPVIEGIRRTLEQLCTAVELLSDELECDHEREDQRDREGRLVS